MINEGRVAGWKDEKGEVERVERMRRRGRQSVKLLCTSLTSWTESAQLLKRSERWGKHADIQMYEEQNLCLAHTHTQRESERETHTPTHSHMYSTVRLILLLFHACASELSVF